MKITLRKIGESYEVYVAKKDLEEKLIASEKPDLWGGWIKISNGWRFLLPEMPVNTPMPISVEARKIGEDDG